MARKTGAQHDWSELAATVLLSIATVVAAWSAYQSTSWNGVQSMRATASAAKRIKATQQNGVYAAQMQLDAIGWLTYLEQVQAGKQRGAAFIRERFRPEFIPAFDAWLALGPAGELPPGTPFTLPEYQPKSMLEANRLNDEAEELTAAARAANEIGDNFVLVAVIMASVLFCAGVSTKLGSSSQRLVILALGGLLFTGGTVYMASLPQLFPF